MDRIVGRMDVACEYGAEVSIFLHSIMFWVEQNAANRNNFHDGRYWTYNSLDAFAALYPLWSRDQIKRIIAKCRDHDLLLVGAYNENPYDRTKWYAPSDKLLAIYGIEITAECIWRNRHIEEGETAKCTYGEIDTCNKVQGNTQENTPIVPKTEKRVFVPPTIEEVRAYCEQRGNGISPEAFIDYYATRGWLLGKTRMKDWKAAVRTWENRRKQDGTPAPRAPDDDRTGGVHWH